MKDFIQYLILQSLSDTNYIYPTLGQSKSRLEFLAINLDESINTTGLDTLDSEKATSSGTSINYTINAFGIGYTTSTLTR